jgi:hypothetical protein
MTLAVNSETTCNVCNDVHCLLHITNYEKVNEYLNMLEGNNCLLYVKKVVIQESISKRYVLLC